MNAKAVLEDVKQYGEVLLLKDGRRLMVLNPEDATMASIWLPPARLTLRPGQRAVSNLSVTNEETGETVSARADA